MDGYSRERMMAGPQGEAAHRSPTQTPAAFSTGPQPHQSPNAVPLPHQQHNHSNHHPHHAHPHHQRSPNTPGATELPSISTAIYSAGTRDRNTYYDPTQDNGPVGRDAGPHASHYPPPVRL